MHNREDLYFTVSRALPAQNTNANTSSIDLEDATPELVGEIAELHLELPATTTATGQTITLTIQDSADNSSFAAVTGLSTIVLTGVDNATAALSRPVRLPRGTRQYVRINIAMSATTGDQTAISFTFKLKF